MPHPNLFGVTATLCELLRVNIWRLSGQVVTVSALPPEDAEKEIGSRLNLHLYHAAEDPHRRNAFPTDDAGPYPISRTPLPLTLYYVMTAHSVINNNGSHGISYSGKRAAIFDNLVYSNGCSGCGDYGISILGVAGFNNAKHKVTNNTIYGNLSGGLRLSDDQASSVFGTAVNNIIMANPVGIKEQGGGSFTLDYNDVFANGSSPKDNYQLLASVIGANSMSAYPEFVNPAINDFRLSRVGAGQTVNSPCIDAGSTTAEALNLGRRTTFTDNSPDAGIVDLGYHGTEL